MRAERSASSFSLAKALFVAAALIVSVIIPSYFALTATAQEAPAGETFFSARLSGPKLNNFTPFGFAAYAADSVGKRVLHVELSYIDLPAGTTLGVSVDGAAIATARVSAYKTAGFELKTESGQVVPIIGGNSTITIKNAAGTAILTGVFAPPPSPSPTPTGSPRPSPSPIPTPSLVLYSALSGATIDGVLPKGVSNYFEFGATSKSFGVYVEHVKLATGTRLAVDVNGTSIGSFTLNNEGQGRIQLNTLSGASIPAIASGATLNVKNGATTILTGTFRSPTQAPPPTPKPNRVFGGKMNGGSVVPAVTGNGRGLVGVMLNEAETSITVEVGFIDLSSNQTSATINGPAIVGENGPMIFNLGGVGGTVGRIERKIFTVTADQVAQLRAGSWYIQIGTANNPSGEIRGQIKGQARNNAFNGTQTDDVAVYRPSTGTWYVADPAGGLTAKNLGSSSDTPISADYDGDGKSDYAVFRDGTWTISRSSDGGTSTKYFGMAGDIPVRGDYNGDGITDITVYRPTTGTWFFLNKDGVGLSAIQFGLNEDQPVPADLDGDGKTDIAVFRPSNGVWYSLLSSTGKFYAVQFGLNGDVPVVADFDGDGADDITVYRPSNGIWYTWKAASGTFDVRQFGISTDVPVAGNFDGDGVTDIAVFRPSTGVWYIWKSSDNTVDYRYFGTSGDIPAGKN